MTELSSSLIDETLPTGPLYTVEVSGVSEEIIQRLDALARQRGSDRSQVIRDLITRELGSDVADMTGHSFDAALAPIRAGFAESGMSEAEAETLLDQELRAVRTARRQARAAKRDEAVGVSNDR